MTAGLSSARALLKTSTPERDFQRSVTDLARVTHWLTYHTHDSRRSAAGFPDLTLVRGDRLVFAELKRAGQNPTEAQREWLEALGRVERVEAHLWRPGDWEEIERVLGRSA